jgi:pilus assembly protein CpaB
VNPRQRRGLLLIAISALGLLGVFVLIAQYVADVREQVDPKVQLLALAKPVKANQAITDDMLTTVEMPERWAPPTAMRDAGDLVGLVAGTDLTEDTLLQRGMLVAPPDLAPGEREVAILVDAETGVAGKIGPGKVVDIVATFPATDRKAAQARVIVPSARIVEVGQVRLEGGDTLREQQAQDPGQVVPVTFALSPEEVLVVAHAEQNADNVRLSLLRPGDRSELKGRERAYQREPDPAPEEQ